jgi:hypothetical protein
MMWVIPRKSRQDIARSSGTLEPPSQIVTAQNRLPDFPERDVGFFANSSNHIPLSNQNQIYLKNWLPRPLSHFPRSGPNLRAHLMFRRQS